MNIYQEKLYHQTPLRILSFLSVYGMEILSAKEIQERTKSSKGATNQALRLLSDIGVLLRDKKGNAYLYKLNPDNAILKQFKIFEIMLGIRKLIEEIRPYSHQIILYGSCATGSNTSESDIDLFIKTEDEYKNKIQKLINKHMNNNLQIRAVIQDPLEIASSKKEDKVFFDQVKKGIVLWEGIPDYETV